MAAFVLRLTMPFSAPIEEISQCLSTTSHPTTRPPTGTAAEPDLTTTTPTF
jgi:hypothetical protein